MKHKNTFIKLLLISFILSLFNQSFVYLFVLIFSVFILYTIYSKIKINKSYSEDTANNNNNNNIITQNNSRFYYEIKDYLTPNELVFYHKLINVSDNFIIIPQVPLSSIIKKVNGGKYQSELTRVIDFGIFDKNFRLLLLVELNDSSHKQVSRRDRDLKVKKILDDCFIKLLTFYTYYPNEQEYVSKRIKETLNIDQEHL